MTLIMSDKRLYFIWAHMMDRCYNPKNKAFKDYGSKGIKVCDMWQKFPYFESWARVSGYESHLTLNRVYNDKGYSPSNCDWITKQEQCRNRSNNHLLPDGSLACDLARKNGIAFNTFFYRVKRGWTTTEAATTPLYKKPKIVKSETL